MPLLNAASANFGFEQSLASNDDGNNGRVLECIRFDTFLTMLGLQSNSKYSVE